MEEYPFMKVPKLASMRKLIKRIHKFRKYQNKINRDVLVEADTNRIVDDEYLLWQLQRTEILSWLTITHTDFTLSDDGRLRLLLDMPADYNLPLPQSHNDGNETSDFAIGEWEDASEKKSKGNNFNDIVVFDDQKEIVGTKSYSDCSNHHNFKVRIY